jgi:hypothetical protein
LSTGAHHLVANDVLDPTQAAESEIEICVNAGGVLPDIAGAHEEIVTDRFGIGTALAERPSEEL